MLLPFLSIQWIILISLQVADASPIPTMIYNFPVVTAGLDLDSDTILALAKHPNIVGTKLSCADVGKLHRLTSTLPATKFATFPGSSAVFLQGLVSGSAGIIGALPNVAPKAHAELYRLYKEGKLAEADSTVCRRRTLELGEELQDREDSEGPVCGSFGGDRPCTERVRLGQEGERVRAAMTGLSASVHAFSARRTVTVPCQTDGAIVRHDAQVLDADAIDALADAKGQ